MLEVNIAGIPDQLKQHPYWNGCLAVSLENGRISKPPLQPSWKLAKTSDLKTWVNFEAACKFYHARKGQTFNSPKTTGRLAGIGILLADGTLTTIDIDHCIKADGTLENWAQEIVKPLAAITYVEYSISGTGLHIYMFASKSGLHCRHKQIEIYDKVRFMVVTGHIYPSAQSTIASGEDVQAILNEIEASISGNDTPPLVDKKPQPTKHINYDLSDSELLQKARYAQDGRVFSSLFDTGDITKYPSASEADQALANKLAFWTAKDADRIERLMRQSALKRDKWDKHPTYLKDTITKAIDGTDKVYAPTARAQRKATISTREREIKALPQKPGQDTNKICIEYAPGQMPRMKRELEQAFKNTIYQLGESLARVINVPRKDPSENEIIYITRIDPLSVDAALGEADEVSTWYKVKEDKKTGDIIETPINAPIDVVKQLLSWKKWKLPLISGVVNCPVMRANGSIIDNPGYDKATGLYAYFNPADFPKVNNNPTDREIQKSYELIKSVLAEFPFKIKVEDEDNHELPEKHISRAVAISMLLTPLIQACLNNIPLFAITSPIPGTGKSYLADLVSIILCGARADFMNFIPDETEFEKAIFAKLLEGTQCCLIDNIDRPLNSPKLNSILTQERMSGRVLGLSKNASVSTKCLFMATGNNLEVMGDLTRRTLLCILDANTERPAERNFKNANLHQWALKNRGQLVHAGLTILRGHFVAGFPGAKGLTPFNSFNQWSEWIRGAVIWLGEDDPCNSQDTIREGDSERQQFLDVVNAWHEAYKNSSKIWRTAKDILEPPVDPALKAALEDAVPYGRELNTRALAKWLKKNNHRIIDKKQLLGRIDTGTKIMEWRVKAE